MRAEVLSAFQANALIDLIVSPQQAWVFEKDMAGYMQEAFKNTAMQHTTERGNANEAANRGHGPQGVDKAPGEETSQDQVPFTQESQKGKKEDADLTKESDKPAQQQDL